MTSRRCCGAIPGTPGRTARLADLAGRRGDTQAALTHALLALRAEDSADALLAAGDAYAGADRIEDALQLFQQVLARDPDHPVALRARATPRCRTRDGRTPSTSRSGSSSSSAPRSGRSSANASPGSTTRSARAGWPAGTLAGAVGAFRDALRVQADFVPAHVGLGDAHQKTGDGAQALRAWERGLDAAPALPAAPASRGARPSSRGSPAPDDRALRAGGGALSGRPRGGRRARARLLRAVHARRGRRSVREDRGARAVAARAARLPGRASSSGAGSSATPARNTAAGSTPPAPSSGRIAARRAGPPTWAGRIGARRVAGGTRSARSGRGPSARLRVVAVAGRAGRPRLPSVLSRLRPAARRRPARSALRGVLGSP